MKQKNLKKKILITKKDQYFQFLYWQKPLWKAILNKKDLKNNFLSSPTFNILSYENWTHSQRQCVINSMSMILKKKNYKKKIIREFGYLFKMPWLLNKKKQKTWQNNKKKKNNEKKNTYKQKTKTKKASTFSQKQLTKIKV